MRLVLVADEAAGVQVLHNLLALPEPPEVVAVFTNPSRARARRAIVHEAATALGIPALPVDALRADALRRDAVHLLLNVHSLSVLPADVVAAPRIGSFNLHPGPLPQYAGLNAPSWAIYRGESRHGVTLHWMDAGIDTGPLAYSESFELADDETGLSATARCIRLGVPLVSKLVAVAAADAGAIPRLDQDRTSRRYFGAGAPNGGRLDWSRPAAELERLVRAADYGPFPSPWGDVTAEVGGRVVVVKKARVLPEAPGALPSPGAVVAESGSSVTVSTGDGLLVVELSP